MVKKVGAGDGCIRVGSSTGGDEAKIGDRCFVYVHSAGDNTEEIRICGERDGKKITPLSQQDPILPQLKLHLQRKMKIRNIKICTAEYKRKAV